MFTLSSQGFIPGKLGTIDIYRNGKPWGISQSPTFLGAFNGALRLIRKAMDLPVQYCRSCQAPIVWGVTEKGKRCPYNVVDGQPTRESHFATCPQAKQWSKNV